VNIGVIVVAVIVAWSMLAIIVAVLVGSMAKARDSGAMPVLDHTLAGGRMQPPARDETVRAAI
jgi:hypothetical protein